MNRIELSSRGSTPLLSVFLPLLFHWPLERDSVGVWDMFVRDPRMRLSLDPKYFIGEEERSGRGKGRRGRREELQRQEWEESGRCSRNENSRSVIQSRDDLLPLFPSFSDIPLIFFSYISSKSLSFKVPSSSVLIIIFSLIIERWLEWSESAFQLAQHSSLVSPSPSYPAHIYFKLF